VDNFTIGYKTTVTCEWYCRLNCQLRAWFGVHKTNNMYTS
jgi:hypothetical protein